MTNFYWSTRKGDGAEVLALRNEVGREQAVCFSTAMGAAQEAQAHDGAAAVHRLVEGRWTWVIERAAGASRAGA